MRKVRHLMSVSAATAFLLADWGCGPPEIAPSTPPGIELTRVTAPAEGETSEALGESVNMGAAPAPANASAGAPENSPPTEKGQTATKSSGLKYVTMRPGKAAAVKMGDEVTVHYKGSLESDGTVFEESRTNGEPYTFTVGKSNVVKGWHEGVLGMQPGEIRKLTIPPQLAWGTNGNPPKIPGNATVVFEIELLKIK